MVSVLLLVLPYVLDHLMLMMLLLLLLLFLLLLLLLLVVVVVGGVVVVVVVSTGLRHICLLRGLVRIIHCCYRPQISLRYNQLRESQKSLADTFRTHILWL
jgi:hypothetical protein